MRLCVRDFAQISEADIDFGEPGDLTLLVGQQATGKSLVLQWLKLLTDPLVVRRDWERYGSNWKTPAPLRPLDLFFGEGLGAGFRPGKTQVTLDSANADLASLFRKPSGSTAEPVETTYYIPAHRALLLADGWPKNFQQHGPGTPYVARAQSERLARWLSESGESVFPVSNRLPQQIRKLFDEAIFHSAALRVDRSSPQSRLVLHAGESSIIPFMAWTAGQREFVPMLLALYELMPAGGLSRLQKAGKYDVKTVVLEEPELGLHPKALFAVGVIALHLMARGYRVVISTHSPLMVDFAWAINRLRIAHTANKAAVKDFLSAFEMRSTAPNIKLAETLLACHARTYYLTYRAGNVVNAKDISELASYSRDAEQNSWGELLKYSTRLAEVIGNLDFDFSANVD